MPQRTYALLIDSLDDEHEVAVVRGAIAAAREAQASLLCIAGGIVDPSDRDRAAKNLVFELLPPGVDGVLALSSALGCAIGATGLEAWLARFAPRRVTCLGAPVAGYASITIDNEAGLASVVGHLIRVHGARRIAFFRGPPGSVEAEQRFRSFSDTLAAAGIETDGRLVADGDFSKASGARALGVLLDERRVAVAGLDAIVAANDYMALGAIDELSRREIAVPEQIAVVGFDDVPSARSSRPTLTTVRQPAEDIGREGIRHLEETSHGVSPHPDRALPTELVIRRSCGCPDPDAEIGSSAHLPVLGAHLESSFVQRRQVILAEVVRAARGRFGAARAAWESRLLEALIGELRGEASGGFSRALAELLRRVEKSQLDPLVIQDVLTALRRQSLACVAGDPLARDRLEDALHDARALAAAITAQAGARRARAAADSLRVFSRRARAAVLEGESLSEVAKEELPAIGVEACLVAELHTPGDIANQARLAFGFGPRGPWLPNERLAPSALARHVLFEQDGRPLVLLPVVATGTLYGVAALSVSAINGAELDDLSDLFGTLLAVRALGRRGPE